VVVDFGVGTVGGRRESDGEDFYGRCVSAFFISDVVAGRVCESGDVGVDRGWIEVEGVLCDGGGEVRAA
jgi:hypothetical protein